MSVSTVPAVRTTLLNLCTANVTNAGGGVPNVVIQIGDLGTYAADEAVWIGAVHRTVRPFQVVGSGGTGWLDETYSVEVHIEIYRGGGEESEQVAETRAWAVLGQIETALRADPTLSAQVIQSVPGSSQYDLEWDENHMGVTAHINLGVDVHARI